MSIVWDTVVADEGGIRQNRTAVVNNSTAAYDIINFGGNAFPVAMPSDSFPIFFSIVVVTLKSKIFNHKIPVAI